MFNQVGVPRDKKTDAEVSPSASTNIRQIKAKFLRDEEDRSRKKPTDKMSIADVEALESGAAELALRQV